MGEGRVEEGEKDIDAYIEIEVGSFQEQIYSCLDSLSIFSINNKKCNI